jgi:hypothetical protein
MSEAEATIQILSEIIVKLRREKAELQEEVARRAQTERRQPNDL